jgi:hypothetical protein
LNYDPDVLRQNKVRNIAEIGPKNSGTFTPQKANPGYKNVSSVKGNVWGHSE